MHPLSNKIAFLSIQANELHWTSLKILDSVTHYSAKAMKYELKRQLGSRRIMCGFFRIVLSQVVIPTKF